jgi:hypothetical protein
MREILFRGQLPELGSWVYGVPDPRDKTQRTLLSNIDNPVMPLACFDIIPDTLGQYTGMKDTNGKMIFEGDILRCSKNCHEGRWRHKINPKTGKPFPKLASRCPTNVWFKDGSFVVGQFPCLLSAMDKDADGELSGKPDVEVIGNVHDNPELLPKVVQETDE